MAKRNMITVKDVNIRTMTVNGIDILTPSNSMGLGVRQV